MKWIYRFSLMTLLVLALISTPFTNMVQPVAAGIAATCVNTVNTVNSYTVQVCITSPASGSTLTGDWTISGTVTVISGTDPGTAQVVFYLDSNYLLTDFHSPWTFTLPTNKFADGSHTLAAAAVMKDTFTTDQVSIPVTFNTGTATPPTPGNTFTPALGTTPTAGQPFVVAIVGDGADGGVPNTSVASLIATMSPNLFLYLGDVYEKGTISEFMNWYNPSTSFGQFKGITDPTVGSHEYLTGSDSGYQLYWDSTRDYYSFNTAGWHFISLNSNTSKVSGTVTSPQYLWLQNDLKTNTSPCTIVIYHHPYFTIGQQSSNHLMGPIWKLLAQYHVTMVFNGNDHDYERWMPMDGNGLLSPVGITEFVVGTGGHAIQATTSTDSRVAFSSSDIISNPSTTYGALKLELFSDHANFAFTSINGSAGVLDSGSVSCTGSTPTNFPIYLPLIFK